MSAKLRDEIEAKRAKLQELRQARLARQRQDSERRAGVSLQHATSHACISHTFHFSRHLSNRQHRQM
jgi:hypothetical protein